MLNSTILIKIKQRLNKLASNDYDNIIDWQIVEAFNKAQVEWCRRNLHGLNIKQEGDEQSTRRIDDLQVLLNTAPLVSNKKDKYYESDVPANYLQWKRLSGQAKSECCPKPRDLVIYLAEEANVDLLLRDKTRQPSFDWAETFATLENNKIQVYNNNEFDIVNVKLTYYRQPTKIQILDTVDPYTGVTSTVNVESELKDDLIEVIIDETAKILAGDIESFNQMERTTQAVENNN